MELGVLRDTMRITQTSPRRAKAQLAKARRQADTQRQKAVTPDDLYAAVLQQRRLALPAGAPSTLVNALHWPEATYLKRQRAQRLRAGDAVLPWLASDDPNGATADLAKELGLSAAQLKLLRPLFFADITALDCGRTVQSAKRAKAGIAAYAMALASLPWHGVAAPGRLNLLRAAEPLTGEQLNALRALGPLCANIHGDDRLQCLLTAIAKGAHPPAVSPGSDAYATRANATGAEQLAHLAREHLISVASISDDGAETDTAGFTTVMYAMRLGDEDLVERMLEQGLPVFPAATHAPPQGGWTPAHVQTVQAIVRGWPQPSLAIAAELGAAPETLQAALLPGVLQWGNPAVIVQCLQAAESLGLTASEGDRDRLWRWAQNANTCYGPDALQAAPTFWAGGAWEHVPFNARAADTLRLWMAPQDLLNKLPAACTWLPEIVQMVLDRLPPADFLNAKLVCRAFNHLATGGLHRHQLEGYLPAVRGGAAAWANDLRILKPLLSAEVGLRRRLAMGAFNDQVWKARTPYTLQPLPFAHYAVSMKDINSALHRLESVLAINGYPAVEDAVEDAVEGILAGNGEAGPEDLEDLEDILAQMGVAPRRAHLIATTLFERALLENLQNAGFEKVYALWDTRFATPVSLMECVGDVQVSPNGRCAIVVDAAKNYHVLALDRRGPSVQMPVQGDSAPYLASAITDGGSPLVVTARGVWSIDADTAEKALVEQSPTEITSAEIVGQAMVLGFREAGRNQYAYWDLHPQAPVPIVRLPVNDTWRSAGVSQGAAATAAFFLEPVVDADTPVPAWYVDLRANPLALKPLPPGFAAVLELRLETSHDGSTVARVDEETATVAVFRITNGDALTISLSEDTGYAPRLRLSGDGRLLSMLTPGDGEGELEPLLTLWDIGGKTPVQRPLGITPFPGVEDVAFSPDNQYMVTAAKGGTQLWDVTHNPPQVQILDTNPAQRGMPNQVRFADDGRSFGVTYKHARGQVRIYDFKPPYAQPDLDDFD